MISRRQIHEVKRGARVGWRCTACSFQSENDAEANRHAIRNQWDATEPLPADLQLTPAQAAVTAK